MKTIIFFLALLFSFTTIAGFILEILAIIVRKVRGVFIMDYIFALITCALWTYFYYL